ncbi:hypothetical protein DRO38_02495, partial [Candidatus Bathyarchaeota archaeon]
MDMSREKSRKSPVNLRLIGGGLLLCSLFFASSVFAGTTSYDFSTGAGTDKWGYEAGVSTKPPSTNDVPSDETVTYNNIASNDGVFEEAKPNVDNIYPAQRFKFTINEEESSVREIYVFWNGLADGKNVEGSELYLWNFNSGSYISLDSSTVKTEVDLTGTISQNCPYYIDANGYLNVLAVSHDSKKGSKLKTDYIKVDITYNTPPTVTINSTTQKTDGTGQVEISIEADDPEEDDSRVSVYYGETAETCTNKATMTGTATADIPPAPDVTTTNVYQIGDDIPIKTTGAGSNTVTFNWDSKADLANTYGTYYIKITINDGQYDCSSPPTTSLIIDNVNPTNPSAPCSGYWTPSKVNSILNNTWQNDDNTPYFEWSGASDVGSGVSGYSVYWGGDSNGEPGTTKEQSGNAYEVTTPTSDGIY